MQSFSPIHMAVKGEVCACCPPSSGQPLRMCQHEYIFSTVVFGMICFILFAKVGVIFQSNKFFKNFKIKFSLPVAMKKR